MAERGDLGPGVEWVNFDLVDGWMHSKVRCEKLLQLERVHKRMTRADNRHRGERRTKGKTYMLDAKVADTSSLHLSIFNGIFDSLPAFQSLGLSTIRAVQQKQIYIAEATLLYRLSDGLSCRIVGSVGCEFRCEMEVFSFQR